MLMHNKQESKRCTLFSARRFSHSEATVAIVSSFSEDVHIEHSKKSGFGQRNQLLCLYFQPHFTDLAAAFRLRLLVENGSHPSCDLSVQRRDGGRNPLFLHGDTRQFRTKTRRLRQIKLKSLINLNCAIIHIG